MLERLDAGGSKRAENLAYFEARQPMAYVAPGSKLRFGRIAANACRVSIQSVVNRLQIIGFRSPDPVFDEFLRLDLDSLAELIHTEMLVQGSAYLLIWFGADGRPTATVESADQVAVKRDPVSREVVSALKRVVVRPTPTARGYCEVWLYGPDEIEHYRSDSPDGGNFELLDVVVNPLGQVPMVPFVNRQLLPSNMSAQYLEDAGVSDLEDLKPLVDQLNHVLAGQTAAIEWTAQPRRYLTGLQLIERPRVDEAGDPVLNESGGQIIDTKSPVAVGPDLITLENENAKVGQLEGASLDGFTHAANLIVQQILMVSALTPGMAGINTANPATAEAMRMAESNLTAKAESKARMLSKPWESAMRLIWAIRSGVDPVSVDVRVVWRDPASKSESAEADAAQKLYASDILSRTTIWRRMGMTDDQIEQEILNFDTDAHITETRSLAQALKFSGRLNKPSRPER